MLRCSPKAYTKCPDHHLCGPIEAATFTDDSECAAFNWAVESKPMTNADRIRAMSDEELAAFIDKCEGCGYLDSSIAVDEHGHLMEMIDWLQQPEEKM